MAGSSGAIRVRSEESGAGADRSPKRFQIRDTGRTTLNKSAQDGQAGYSENKTLIKPIDQDGKSNEMIEAPASASADAPVEGLVSREPSKTINEANEVAVPKEYTQSLIATIRSTPLTNPGERFEISEDQRKFICLLDDGRLFVAKSQRTGVGVSSMEMRLSRSGFQYEMHLVDMSVIANIYASANAGKFGAELQSDMQTAALNLFTQAVKMRASDIHIRATKNLRTEIRFRVHNDLEFIREDSPEFGIKLMSSIYQSMTDVSDANFEEMSTQDARISDKKKLPPMLDGIRIATTPYVNGVAMVMRLLYNDSVNDSNLEKRGYHPGQVDAIELMKRRPTGINIIAGPTGSGKSTTLQCVLSSIIKETDQRKHVITVEDPPEYPIPGAVQTPVTNADSEESRSAAFQRSIKAAMRLDPDIIMIGEVRDAASARLAIQAAMTGHQVWTTVHANNAMAIVDRLLDLNVPIELLTDPTIVSGLNCQRLLKVLCPHCKKSLSDKDVEARYSERDLARIYQIGRLDNIHVVGDGCEHCRHTGIAGRTVVAETIICDHKIMQYLRKRDKIEAINYWKREQGGITMIEHAILKVCQGLVDPFQAEDVVGPLTMAKIESDYSIDSQEIRSAL